MKLTYTQGIIGIFTMILVLFSNPVASINTIQKSSKKNTFELIEKPNTLLKKNTYKKLSWKEKIVSRVLERKLKKALTKKRNSTNDLEQNKLARLAIVTSFVGLLTFLVGLLLGSSPVLILSLVLAIIGMVLGISSYITIKKSDKYKGKGLAVAAFLIGVIPIGVYVFFAFLYL